MTLETQTRAALIDQAQHFLASFKDKAGSFSYVEEIDQMMAKQVKYIVVDYNDIVSQKDIEIKFNSEPDEILYAFSRAVKNILEERFPEYAKKIADEIRVRIANYPIQRSLRQINAEVIGKMTSVSGMVVRSSEVKPLAKNLVYKCPEKHLTEVPLERGLGIYAPSKCSHEKCTHRDLRIDPDQSKFIDFQIARLQELPEDLPPGQLPHYIDVTIRQDLVDNARPGDRIILTGIVRIEQEQITGTRVNSGLHRLRIEGNNIEFLGGRGTKNSRRSEREEISPEEEKIIKSLARSPEIYERLVNSFAPHIQGHSLIKESILLLIVGSNQKILQDGTKIRGDINIFLVGDPGTGKSEMLKFCARIAPRGLYTSGRGSTAAGLTAAVVRDKSGILMLEAGAVVLGDQGVVCMTEDTELYTGNALVPVGKLWDSIKGDIYITKSGREAKKELIPIGIYDNNIRADIDGNAFAIMRKKHTGDIIKLTFSSGLTLKLTPEHLLRRTTHLKNKWIEAQDVKAGDVIRAPVRVFKPACTLELTENEAYVIGCVYGDGYTTTHSITISQSKVNSDVIENIRKHSEAFALCDKGDRIRTIGKYALVSRMYQLFTTDKALLRKTRFLIKSPSVDNILLLSDKSLWSFLAGVFDTDGDFNHVHDKIVAARLYPSTSEHELRVVLYALRRVGIYAKIRKTRKGFPLIQITGSDTSRFVEGIKSHSVKAQREGTIEIHHKSSITRGTEKVVRVERVLYDGYVYDLSVGNYHNYEASLVYIHNCIDEFDKMKPEDRSALHEVMEQQSASIAKGGIVATLNARTSILAGANPMYGKYDPFKNITENVALPIPLLTRFDLIFVVRDIPSKEKDRNIAKHIINLHKRSSPDARSLIDVDIFTKYLGYCKKSDPVLTPEAEEKLLEYYMKMRNVESEEMITVTPRQLGGLIRLATARARLLMKTQVDGEDAERAIFLIQSMLEDAGVDVNTGKVDLGVLQGRPHSEVSKLQLFMDVLRSLEGDTKTAVEEKLFVKELAKTGKFTEEEARNFIRRMLREASIYESKPGHYNRV
jgi:DNA replicative helicase MCM subunit Mcm2 (Cdc46/Mcm family)/intein/homing endonuclease